MYLRRERDKFCFASDSGEHCHGIVLGGDRGSTLDAAAAERLDIDAIKARCATVITARSAYDQLHAMGLEYGPMFQTLQTVHSGDDEALGELAGTESVSAAGPLASMPLLDGALQTSIFALRSFSAEGVFVPVRIGEVIWDQASAYRGRRLFSHVQICPCAIEFNQPAGRTITVNVKICDTQGGVLMAMHAVTLQRIGNPAKVPFRDWLYRTAWQPRALPSASAAAGGGALELTRALRAAAEVPSLQLAQAIALQRKAAGAQDMLSRLASGFAARLLETIAANAAADRAGGVAVANSSAGDAPSAATMRALRCAANYPNPPATGEDLMGMAQLMKKSCPALAVEIDAIQAVGRAAGDCARRRAPFSGAAAMVAEAPLVALESRSSLDVALRTVVANVLAPYLATHAAQGSKTVLRVLETHAGSLARGAGICSALKTLLPNTVTSSFDFQVGADIGVEATASDAVGQTVVANILKLRAPEMGKSEDLTEGSFDVVVTTSTEPRFLAYCATLIAPGGVLCGVTNVWRVPLSAAGGVEAASPWIAFIAAVLGGAESVAERSVAGAADADALVAALTTSGFAAAETVAFAADAAEVHGVAFVARRATASAARASRVVELDGGDARAVAQQQQQLRDAIAAERDCARSVHVVLRQPSLRLICDVLAAFAGAATWPLTTIVTDGAQIECAAPAHAGVIGFARSVMNEHPQWELRLADFEALATLSSENVASALAQLSAAPLGAERELAYRRDEWLAPRLRPFALTERAPETVADNWALEVTSPGRLDTAQFHARQKRSLPANYVRIAVKAAALNFKDLMIAMGLLEGLGRGAGIGFEGSGIITELGSVPAGHSSGLAVGQVRHLALRGL